MPPVTYAELGRDAQLNEIVVAGSHDAGITSGQGNVKTQALNIGEQAAAGVRFFDLRIAAAATGHALGGRKVVELRAFHADGLVKKDETKTRLVKGIGSGIVPVAVERTKLHAGGFGEGLVKMLSDARAFVTSQAGRDEFLLLKFDKCLNWGLIAEACVQELAGVLHTAGGNLNTARLGDLAGHVVVLFSPDGIAELKGQYGPSDGILPYVNLAGGGGYDPSFAGLQYYGKGGTTVKPWKDKIAANVKKQGKLMQGAKAFGLEEVIRMMYWTSTGLSESIETRDGGMWEAPNVARMKALWKSGLEEYVQYTNPLLLPQGSPAIGPTRKRFLPNVVMIDFADARRCGIIRGLNDLSPSDLARL